MRDKQPERMLELSYQRHASKRSFRTSNGKKLHVYAGAEHPHEAQKPEVYELRG